VIQKEINYDNQLEPINGRQFQEFQRKTEANLKVSKTDRSVKKIDESIKAMSFKLIW